VLKLLCAVVDSGGKPVYYVYSINGTVYPAASPSDMVSLIKKTDVGKRTCQLRQGAPGNKNNYGDLPELSLSEARKQYGRAFPKTTVQVYSGVEIFTRNEYTAKYPSEQFIRENDWWFGDKVRTDRAFLLKHEKGVLGGIDGARIADEENLKIDTPFGTCDIDSLSTGCKTMLNVLYLKEKGDKSKRYLLNINEAGDRVVNLIFKEVAGTNIALYLQYAVCPEDMGLCYRIDGVEVKDEYDFLDKITAE
jgi:hypothetical protein